MRETVFSERYYDYLTFLSEKLLTPSESHVASKPFQPGFALIPSNPHSIPVLSMFFFPFWSKAHRMCRTLGTVCVSGVPCSLPFAIKIPNHPTPKRLWLRKKRDCYNWAILIHTGLTEKERRGFSGFWSYNLDFLEKQQMTWYRQRAFCSFWLNIQKEPWYIWPH